MDKMKVVVIDDEPQMTKLLKLILVDELGCDVETFNDPTAALKRLNEQEFDVISLDHRMPVMTGVALVRILRSQPGVNQTTPVMIFTGFLEEAEKLRPEEIENLLFLEKPIEDERYLRNIKLAMQMKKQSAKSA